MGAFTVRLPDDKHQRLRALAESRGTTMAANATVQCLCANDTPLNFRQPTSCGASAA